MKKKKTISQSQYLVCDVPVTCALHDVTLAANSYVEYRYAVINLIKKSVHNFKKM